MEKRVLICQESIYKSNLHNGILIFMALLCVDYRIPILLKKEKIIGIVLKQLKKLERAEFPDLAKEAEKEIENLLPNCDLIELRKLILQYYIVDNSTHGLRIDILNFASVTSKKVLKYLDEQLYINVLNCVYDLMREAAKSLSLGAFSMKLKIGRKTCDALYPELQFEEAMEALTQDIQTWINYNLLITFCSLEMEEDAIYLKVTI